MFPLSGIGVGTPGGRGLAENSSPPDEVSQGCVVVSIIEPLLWRSLPLLPVGASPDWPPSAAQQAVELEKIILGGLRPCKANSTVFCRDSEQSLGPERLPGSLRSW